ncbi:hypothetical protein NEOKW01_0897 [Nematocida sp. AWRm80]|nr:hypothetical protein NEOKW01_0897 [Nematocida sp. AWRm80]
MIYRGIVERKRNLKDASVRIRTSELRCNDFDNWYSRSAGFMIFQSIISFSIYAITAVLVTAGIQFVMNLLYTERVDEFIYNTDVSMILFHSCITLLALLALVVILREIVHMIKDYYLTNIFNRNTLRHKILVSLSKLLKVATFVVGVLLLILTLVNVGLIAFNHPYYLSP